MRTTTIPVRPSRYGEADHWETEHVIAVSPRSLGERFPDRYGVGFVGPGGAARRVQDGPVLPGPYAYLFGLSVTIDNHGGTGRERRLALAAGTEHDLENGDLVVVRGYTFKLTTNRWKDRQLELVEPQPVGGGLTDGEVAECLEHGADPSEVAKIVAGVELDLGEDHWGMNR